MRNLESRSVETDTAVLDVYDQAISKNPTSPSVTNSRPARTENNYNIAKLIQSRKLHDDYGNYLNMVLAGNKDEITASELANSLKRDPSIPLEGYLTVYPLIGRGVVNRPYDFLEALAGFTAVGIQAGYKGLLVTFDEFEVQTNLVPEARRRIVTLLEAFLQYFKEIPSQRVLPRKFPIKMIIGSVNEEDDTTGIVHILNTLSDHNVYQLENHSKDELLQLAEEISRLYGEAYELEIQSVEEIFEDVFASLPATSGILRAFIKGFVYRLDSQYFPIPAPA